MAGGGGDDHDEATSFDLTALMDVLSNIIFFLMASFGAAVIAIVPASVPTISDSGDNDTATEETKVTLTVKVAANGDTTVSIANNQMLPEELTPYAKSFSGKEGHIDGKAIGEHLWSIKDKYRESKDCILVPDDEVTYGLLIEAMDAVRERHLVVDGKSVYPQMFPAVVVSSLVK